MLSYGNLQKAMKVDIAVSKKMADKILLWNNMYQNKAYWLNGEVKSLELPAAIAAEIARLVTMERQFGINGGKRAEYLSKQFCLVDTNLPIYVEYGCAGGGLIFKPYMDNGSIAVDFVQAGDFYPVAFNRGKITEAIIPEFKKSGKKLYTRIEYHALRGTEYTIINRAFCSENASVNANNITNLGGEISLKEVPEWAELEAESVFHDVKQPLFSYFRIPLANNIDMYSPLGVSVYSRAGNQIRDADEQYGAVMWEYRSKETAIQAGDEFFDRDRYGNIRLPKGMERIYKNLGPGIMDSTGNPFFNVYSPAIRDESFYNGFNHIMQRVEFNSGLAYGTLSDPQNVDKTAEEIKNSKQRSYSTVKAIQNSLETALEDLVYAMDTWTSIYGLAPAGKYETSYKWDDSIVVDAEREIEEYRKDVSMGAMALWEYRMKRYGEDEKTAKENVPEQAEMI